MMHRSIAVQAGHYPRTSGATGTVREQEFTFQLREYLVPMLDRAGWQVYPLDADPPGRKYPDTDLFMALHADGSTNPNAGGASFFFPPRDEVEGLAWGTHWAAAHQSVADYRFGFRRPNYVAALSRNFYAWRASRVAAGIGTPAKTCMLFEHYFATNPEEAEWAWSDGQIYAMAVAHLAALDAWNGRPDGGLVVPDGPPEDSEEDLMRLVTYVDTVTGEAVVVDHVAQTRRDIGQDQAWISGFTGPIVSAPNMEAVLNDFGYQKVGG